MTKRFQWDAKTKRSTYSRHYKSTRAVKRTKPVKANLLTSDRVKAQYTSKAYRAYVNYIYWRFGGHFAVLGLTMAGHLYQSAMRPGLMRSFLQRNDPKAAPKPEPIIDPTLAAFNAEMPQSYNRKLSYAIPELRVLYAPPVNNNVAAALVHAAFADGVS